MVGKGQPPKSDGDKRKVVRVYVSDNDRKEIEKAREKEAAEKSLSTYMKDIVVDHVKEVKKYGSCASLGKLHTSSCYPTKSNSFILPFS